MLFATNPRPKIGLLGYDFRVMLNDRVWKRREKLKRRAADAKRKAAERVAMSSPTPASVVVGDLKGPKPGSVD
jgi:hypothetical protein